MKKITLFLFTLISFQIHAQTISNIYSVPANPTTADDVYILVDCQFNSSSCNTHTQNHSFLTATDIGAGALHCLGPLAAICNYTDTFALGMLAAGNYTFTFQLDEGFGIPFCTPGIAPGPSDSYNFTVSVPTSIDELEETAFTIYPNPATEELRIENAELRIEKIEIYNILGEQIYSQRPGASQQLVIDVSTLSPGIYFAQLKAGNKSFGQMFSVQR